MAQRSDYEYAALSACEAYRTRTGAAYSGALFVVDMDSAAAALCDCAPDGVTLREEIGVSGFRAASFRDALEALSPGAAEKFEVAAQSVAHAYRRYQRTGHKRDPDALEGIPCSRLDAAFSECARLYRELFQKMDPLIKRLGEDGNWAILPLGAMARNCLAAYALRDYFSFDAFQDDPAFWDAGDISFENARARNEEHRPLGRRFALVLSDAAGKACELLLADRDCPLSRLKTPAYSAPFLLSALDSLRVSVDGEIRLSDIPDALTLSRDDVCLAQAALELREGRLCILLRKNETEGSDVTLSGDFGPDS